MGNMKLKWKIFAFLLGFCALLLSMLWIFETVLLYDMYKLVRTREISKAITYVEQNIDNPKLFLIFEELMQQKEIVVTKTNDFVAPQPPPDRKGRPRQETITKTKVFTLDDGRTMSLTFHAIITPVDATVSTLKMQLYIITVIMVSMSVGLAIIIARKISQPIEELNKSAKILAKGDYGVAFAGNGFLEIQELSDTLNSTAKELSKVEGLRRELMANVSHDLRTPLSLIYSYAEMMHDFPQEITPRQTQLIMEEAKRLNSLVNDVLDFSRLEKGMEELSLSRFNLTDTLRVTTERIAELMAQKGYLIRFTYDREIFVNTDEVKITQAYYNLLINAINYGGDDRMVEIRQLSCDDSVRIEVQDHGEGIASEELPYIWDRYYTASGNHKRAITGSGLGLSIVRRIFALHGAEYGVSSQSGEGSVFWFALKAD